MLLLACAMLPMPMRVTAQQAVSSAPKAAPALQPVSLAHCYWHFLMYQNHLDARGAELAAQGKDGSALSGHLQSALGFSDADFAIVRASSARLAGEVNALNTKAAGIAAAKSPGGAVQLQALVTEREGNINAEVAYLRSALGPAKTAKFEAFIVQLLSPKSVAVQVTAPPSQPATAGAQP